MFAPRRRYSVPLPNGATLVLGERTLVMGVINVTPDSFADGGHFLDPGRAAEAALRMEAEGADVVDIGGESTRPGAEVVDAAEERRRVEPVFQLLAGRIGIPLSIDTYKAQVAVAALDLGAVIVNDVSALRYDSALTHVLASRGAAVVLMHNRGRSREMYREAEYADVAREVSEELRERVAFAEAAGVARERIIVDPGIGFAKRAEHSLALLAHLRELETLDRPVLVGPSRKSFLKAAIGERDADQRDWGTAAAVTSAVLLGAHIVRVHAVAEMVDVVRTADAIRDRSSGDSPPR
jgi:dihydropteroate synthase